MFIIITSSHSESLKWENLAKKIYFDTQVGGGQDKLAWTAYPPPPTPITKYTEQYDKEIRIWLELCFKLLHLHNQID